MSLNASALAANARSSRSSAGSSRLRRLVERGEVHRGREHVVGRLAHVHVVVRVTPSPASVAITSLAFMFDDVPEPVWKTSIGNWASCSPWAISSAGVGDPLGEVGVEQPEVGVRARGGALDAAEPAHDRHRHALARDREVRDGLRGLAAPQLLGGSCTLIVCLRFSIRRRPLAPASGGAAPRKCAGSGVTSCGSSSARQCAQTSTGSARCAAGVAQHDRRAVSHRCSSPQRMIATTAG